MWLSYPAWRVLKDQNKSKKTESALALQILRLRRRRPIRPTGDETGTSRKTQLSKSRRLLLVSYVSHLKL